MKRSSDLMKVAVAIGGALAFLFVVNLVMAEPHWNNQSTLMTPDDGDSLRPFTVSIGSVTSVLVYYSTQTAAPARNGYPSVDRVLEIENPQAFRLFCSTSSTVSATAGNSFIVFSTAVPSSINTWRTYSAPTQIWCIFEGPFDVVKKVYGWVGFDSGD